MCPVRVVPVLALLLVVGVGCSTTGRSFDVNGVTAIEPGHTTDHEVRDMFGAPSSVQVRGRGGATWSYRFSETQTQDTRVLTRIGAWLARFFGYRTYGSPVNVQHSNEIKHQLVVYFRDDGVVDDYAYERTETPSTRVY